MNKLSNGCYFSNLAVYPTNWETGPKSLLKKTWRIDYRFYDPKFKNEYPKGFQKRIKAGINFDKTMDGRRQMVRDLLQNEFNLLVHQGFNPITKTVNPPKIDPNYNPDINDDTLLIDALNFAYAHKKCVESTKVDLRSVIKYTTIAANQLGYNYLKISDITRKHMKLLLDEIGKIKKEKWTNRTYNYYRSHWLILWNVLDEYEVGDPFVIEKIKQQPKIKTVRKVLTIEQRILIDQELRKSNYRFWVLVQIFFHSGIRRTELCRLRGKDVNLQLQEYTCTVLKGGASEEIVKPIKDIAIPFWEQALVNCGPEQYIFGEGLKPGNASILPEQITRRWKFWVKDKFKDLDLSDFYSLKHSNSDEVSEALDIQAAQKLNGHKKVSTTLIYATNEKKREMARIRAVNNEFGAPQLSGD